MHTSILYDKGKAFERRWRKAIGDKGNYVSQVPKMDTDKSMVHLNDGLFSYPHIAA